MWPVGLFAVVILAVLWLAIGIIITYLKLRQTQRLGFDRKVQLSTLRYFVFGVVIWPLILLLYFQEQERSGYGVSRLNDYFVNAVYAWIWAVEKEAKAAALVAAKVASKRQRRAMIAHLRGFSSDLLRNFPEDPTMRRHRRRIQNLLEEIEARDWKASDAAEEKQRLKECNPELLEALNKKDPDIFVRIYPTLFSKVGWAPPTIK